jgi:hypothetical protein
MAECPICVKGTGRRTLADHVWWLHVPKPFCWCGDPMIGEDRSIAEDIVVFSDHCDSRGGYLAHYLECKLGAADG